MKYRNIISLTSIQLMWLVGGISNAQTPGGDPLYKGVETQITIKESLRVRNEETTYAPYPEVSSNQPLARMEPKPEPRLEPTPAPAPPARITPPAPKMEVIAPPPIPSKPEVSVTRPAPAPRVEIAPPPVPSKPEVAITRPAPAPAPRVVIAPPPIPSKPEVAATRPAPTPKPTTPTPSASRTVVKTPSKPAVKSPPIAVTAPATPNKPYRIEAPKPFVPPVRTESVPQVPVAVVVPPPPTRPVPAEPVVNQFPRPVPSQPAMPLIVAKPVVPTQTVVASIPSIAAPSSSGGPSLTILRTSAHLLARQGVPYHFGRSHPAFGGLDSPGAVQYLLNEIGVQGVPRSTADLSNWSRVNNLLHEFPARPSVMELTNQLLPGNLIFWGDINSRQLTDVMIYLGYDTSRSRHLAFGTRGGTERGLNGYEVDIFDLKLDRERIVATGRIPGLSIH